jgi:hypothetical protein
MDRKILLSYIGCLSLGLVLEVITFRVYPLSQGIYWGVVSGMCIVFASVFMVWSLAFFQKGAWYDYAVQFMGGAIVTGILILFVLGKVDVAISLSGSQLVALPLAWFGGPNALLAAIAVATYSVVGMLIMVLFSEATLILFKS